MADAAGKSSTRADTLGRSMVGLRDIAEELNISISLVSKVLSGRMGTSGATDEMAQRIREKARNLRYLKNRQAAALRTGQQNVIAVCIHLHGEAGSGIVEEMVAGIAEEAARHHQRLMLQYYSTAEDFRSVAPELHGNAVDGVIVGGLGLPELVDDLKEIHRRGLPVVTILDEPLTARFINVGMDQVEVGRVATRHLIEQGCRRIAHFVHVDESPARFNGYRAALMEANIPFESDLIISAQDYSYESGRVAAAKLIGSGVAFDGIVGESDHHAAAALNTLVARGFDVPETVKLIGIDNAPFCQFAYVPLSSVSQEFAARGRLAVQALMAGLRSETIPVAVAPAICPRESSRVSPLPTE